MGKRKIANDPLMYIHQPRLKRSGAKMQHQYSSTNKKSEKNTSAKAEENNEQQKKTIPKRPSGNRFTQQLQEQKPNTIKKPIKAKKNEPTEEENESSEEQMENAREERRKFKDMTLREKVEYFARTPKHLPKLKCEIKTSERSYRGVVLEIKKDDTVLMLAGRKSVSIVFDDIQEVRMLGF
ncbi:hypothetical protein GMD78_19585 [Ornithinibacillus sp. L9]|uniref:Spore coat protein CotO n=1 Tax=Ornithinibacillus caprae TaxID=2678566 RepID=A0A6N8FLP5_9BACI|nr:CotO family spore coat protein [Ornithinibacillus caprae]MUK90562.1 hypothetical protein [Ornithinibacillus caprae]